MKNKYLIAACALLVVSTASFAHQNSGPATGHASAHSKVQTAWGVAGKAGAATRTIDLDMDDQMRFTPAHFSARQGETVRLRVHNRGQVMHEIVLGTPQALQAHAAMMRQHPDMAHDEPYMAHVAPGKSGELVWTFNRSGRFDFACLVAGHFEAGMHGGFTVTP